jgi:hypothetical protein
VRATIVVMSFTYKIDPNIKSVISTASGILANEDVAQLKNELSQDLEFNPDFHHLVDLRGVTDLQISPGNIQVMANSRIFHPSSMTAFVVEGDLQYGMSRIFKAWRDSDATMDVFRSMNDAIVWLSNES